MCPLEELERTYTEARADPAFHAELDDLLRNYAGRPTPLYHARRLSAHRHLTILGQNPINTRQ